MKRTLKDRISALGLSYQKEMMLLFTIVIATIGLAFLSFLLLKEIYVPIFIAIGGILGVYFYLSRYSSLEKANEKEHIDELISLLSYFEIFISNGNNVYTSFRMLLPYSSQFMQDAISSMLSQIDMDKTIGPYINFATKFNDRIIESLMLSIYQMVDNGENSIELTEFDILFNNIKEKHFDQLIDGRRKTLDIFNSFPLIGAGAVTIILSISIVSIIGDYVNVI